MAIRPFNPSHRNGDEQTPAASVGGRVLLPGGVVLALGGGAGEGVVVTVGAGPRITEDPTEGGPVGRGREHRLVEGNGEVVPGDLLDPLGLPLAVGGAEAVGGVAFLDRLARGRQ